jgi:hypothetical protein
MLWLGTRRRWVQVRSAESRVKLVLTAKELSKEVKRTSHASCLLKGMNPQGVRDYLLYLKGWCAGAKSK